MTMDKTEGNWNEMVREINSAAESTLEEKERTRLEALYGDVWDTEQLRKEFKVESFMAPYVIVTKLSDNKRGTLCFQHSPRFYFNWQEE